MPGSVTSPLVWLLTRGQYCVKKFIMMNRKMMKFSSYFGSKRLIFCKIFAPVPVHRSPRPRLPHTPGEWRHLEVSDIWRHLEVSEVVRETESLGALKNGENYFDIQYYLGLFFRNNLKIRLCICQTADKDLIRLDKNKSTTNFLNAVTGS